jgi:spore coat protein A
MTSRRAFFGQAASLGLSAWAGSLVPRWAAAQTVGNPLITSWAGASDPALAGAAWAAKFTNTVPWVLGPSSLMQALAIATPTAYSVKAGQTTAQLLGPGLPATTVWGYENVVGVVGQGVTSPGRTFVVQSGTPITVNWYNNLVDAAGKELPHLLGVDQTIAMQTTGGATPTPINGVPIAIHHHGGSSAPEFDGGPDQWLTPQRKQVGPGIVAANSYSTDALQYKYLNDEEASMHWYHDHADGMTRINAYAGLAGLYVIRDANEAALVKLNLLPTGQQEVPLVIADKLFQANGNLAYVGDIPAFNGWNAPSTAAPIWNPVNATKKLPTFYPIPSMVDPLTGLTVPVIDPKTGNPAIDPNTGFYVADPNGVYDPNSVTTVVAGTQPTHVPEMFGDVICVNGKAWPSLKVEPRQYRLRLLNGSDSRVYNLKFGGLSFFQIGTDQGLLNIPVTLTTITIFPGERKDIVIDFSKVAANTKIVVTNDAAFPYPGGTPTNPAVDPWGTVMQIDVSLPLDVTVNKPAKFTALTVLRGRAAGTPLLPIVLVPPSNAVVRKILLGEGCDEYGRIMPLLGTVFGSTGKVTDADAGTKAFHDAPDIFPKVGATEVWEFWNTTVDAHPIHMHLVKFRIVNRQPFTGTIQQKAMANGWTGVKFTAPPTLGTVPATLSGLLPTPAPLTEQGWKDTVVCPPGQVTRVIATFTKPGTYVYHCHILGHEEHDMMRWFKVQ